MLSDDKFYEKAQKFALFKDTDNKYYTFDEYKALIEAEQTDKDKMLIYIYATDKVAQYNYIEAAKNKGYSVLMMDGQLDVHFIGMLEQKLEKCRFVRVDSDIVENLVRKEDKPEVTLTPAQRDMMTTLFKSQIPAVEKAEFMVMFEAIGTTAQPIVITQNEFMRRMKDMSAMQPGMSFYGEMPDSYNLIVNTQHPLSQRVLSEAEAACNAEINPLREQIDSLNKEISEWQESHKDKKSDEIPAEEKDALKAKEDEVAALRRQENELLSNYAADNKLIRQLVDLALLSNNMLKGEALSRFVKRSVSNCFKDYLLKKPAFSSGLFYSILFLIKNRSNIDSGIKNREGRIDVKNSSYICGKENKDMAEEKYVADAHRYDTMNYRRCGRSGLLLPALSLGLVAQLRQRRRLCDIPARIALTAFDNGITHFDLANNYGPVYGSAETNFGRILKQSLGSIPRRTDYIDQGRI